MKPTRIHRPLGDHPPYADLYYGINALDALKLLPDQSVQTCVTSPPYWNLRDYGNPDQIGLETSPKKYIARLVQIFQQVHRVLKTDGTLWLNLGDSYAGKNAPGKLKEKDLIGIPWLTALYLRQYGWYLRQDVIWHKTNPTPESVKDRCTRSHEYLFLLTKSAQYHFDADAIRETSITGDTVVRGSSGVIGPLNKGRRESLKEDHQGSTRNKRSVWSIPTQAYPGAHFATMPEALVKICLQATGINNQIALDPFSGSATTGTVAMRLGMNYIGIDLNQEYLPLAQSRLLGEAPPDQDQIEIVGGSLLDLLGEIK